MRTITKPNRLVRTLLLGQYRQDSDGKWWIWNDQRGWLPTSLYSRALCDALKRDTLRRLRKKFGVSAYESGRRDGACGALCDFGQSCRYYEGFKAGRAERQGAE